LACQAKAPRFEERGLGLAATATVAIAVRGASWLTQVMFPYGSPLSNLQRGIPDALVYDWRGSSIAARVGDG
jgi:hypothetical protein